MGIWMYGYIEMDMHMDVIVYIYNKYIYIYTQDTVHSHSAFRDVGSTHSAMCGQCPEVEPRSFPWGSSVQSTSSVAAFARCFDPFSVSNLWCAGEVDAIGQPTGSQPVWNSGLEQREEIPLHRALRLQGLRHFCIEIWKNFSQSNLFIAKSTFYVSLNLL